MFLRKLFPLLALFALEESGGALVEAPSPAPAEFDIGEAIEEVAAGIQEWPDGKAPKGSEPPPPPPAAEPPPPPAVPAVSGPAPSPRTPPDLTLAPKTWKPEVAALWAKEVKSPAIRDEIHRREEDFHRGLDTYKANADFGKTYLGLLQPYAQILKTHSIDPARLLGDLLQAHAHLSLSAEAQKTEFFLKLANSYNLDKGKLVAALGGSAPAGAPAPEAAFVDPQVAALHGTITGLESRLNRTEEEAKARKQQEILDQVVAFSKAPGHEHFETVSGHLSSLLRANPGLTLEQAYETAVWANPEVRALLLAKQTADADAAKATKAEADRKAAEAAELSRGINVKSRAKSASATGDKLGTVDDTLKETMAAIAARAS